MSKTINLMGRITIRNQISAPKSTLKPRENQSISRRSEKEHWSYLAWREQKRVTVICYTLKDNGFVPRTTEFSTGRVIAQREVVRSHSSGLQSFYKSANNPLMFLQKSSWCYFQRKIKLFKSLVKTD